MKKLNLANVNDDFISMLHNGKIFYVEFRKLNGTVRKMNARFGVRKNLLGIGLKYNRSAFGNLIVFSMDDNAYRTIKIKNILKVHAMGLEFNVQQ